VGIVLSIQERVVIEYYKTHSLMEGAEKEVKMIKTLMDNNITIDNNIIIDNNNVVMLRFFYEWHDAGYHTDRGYYSYGTEGECLNEIIEDEEILNNLGMKLEEYTEEVPYGCILVREYSKEFNLFMDALKFAYMLSGILDCLKTNRD